MVWMVDTRNETLADIECRIISSTLIKVFWVGCLTSLLPRRAALVLVVEKVGRETGDAEVSAGGDWISGWYVG